MPLCPSCMSKQTFKLAEGQRGTCQSHSCKGDGTTNDSEMRYCVTCSKKRNICEKCGNPTTQ